MRVFPASRRRPFSILPIILSPPFPSSLISRILSTVILQPRKYRCFIVPPQRSQEPRPRYEYLMSRS